SVFTCQFVRCSYHHIHLSKLDPPRLFPNLLFVHIFNSARTFPLYCLDCFDTDLNGLLWGYATVPTEEQEAAKERCFTECIRPFGLLSRLSALKIDNPPRTFTGGELRSLPPRT